MRLPLTLWVIGLTLICFYEQSAIAQSAVVNVANGEDVVFTQDSDAPWKESDRICVTQEGLSPSCGTVTKVEDDTVSAKLDNASDGIKEGASIVREEAKPQADAATPTADPVPNDPPNPVVTDSSGAAAATPAAAPDASPPAADANGSPEGSNTDTKELTRQEIVKFHRDLISQQPVIPGNDALDDATGIFFRDLNVVAGIHEFFNTSANPLGFDGGFEFTIDDSVSLGVEARYYGFSVETSTTTSWGGMVSANIYPHQIYTGFEFQFGLGIGAMSVNNSGVTANVTDYFGLASLGYRFLFPGEHFNIGLHAGGEFHFIPASDTTAYVGLPSLYLDLGFAY